MARHDVIVNVRSKELIVRSISADQIRMGLLVCRNIKASASVLIKAVVDVMRCACITVRAESLHQIRILRDI